MNSCELWKLRHNYYDKKERKLKKDFVYKQVLDL